MNDIVFLFIVSIGTLIILSNILMILQLLIKFINPIFYVKLGLPLKTIELKNYVDPRNDDFNQTLKMDWGYYIFKGNKIYIHQRLHFTFLNLKYFYSIFNPRITGEIINREIILKIRISITNLLITFLAIALIILFFLVVIIPELNTKSIVISSIFIFGGIIIILAQNFFMLEEICEKYIHELKQIMSTTHNNV